MTNQPKTDLTTNGQTSEKFGTVSKKAYEMTEFEKFQIQRDAQRMARGSSHGTSFTIGTLRAGSYR
ncbi:MAG: hypothetical protein EP349_08895 [Alphaproteobacteria bacterium]|nr:MAG: hypothetical protein EP349_08895 [Alphaproteobacteria bacterium]